MRLALAHPEPAHAQIVERRVAVHQMQPSLFDEREMRKKSCDRAPPSSVRRQRTLPKRVVRECIELLRTIGFVTFVPAADRQTHGEAAHPAMR